MMEAIYLGVLLVACSAMLHSDAAETEPAGAKKIICYYTNWSSYRAKPYSFTPAKMDPKLCTHIIYAFANVDEDNKGIVASDPDFDEKQGFQELADLKKVNKDLKAMIGVGGWVKGTLPFSKISSTEENRKEFAKNTVKFLRSKNFDGIDLNWQHPTFREGGKPEDKENYVLLTKAIKEEFIKEAAEEKKPRLELSVSISHDEKYLPGYDLAGFNATVDMLGVICYDYHFSYKDKVSHHSPLFALVGENDEGYKYNINYTVHQFKKLVDASKLILGIPTYGRTFTLANSSDTAMGAPSAGPGEKGPITGEKGFYANYEICDFVKNGNWTIAQPNPKAVGPYAYKGDQWVGYDDPNMVAEKAKYVEKEGMGGAMFWTVDYDTEVKCFDKPFPHIWAARAVFYPDSPSEVKETALIQTTTAAV